MTEEQRTEWLLDLQEHPEQLTDEQLKQILADKEMRQLVQQLGFAKRAFQHDALKSDTPDVDAEWEKFVASHAEKLDTLDKGERNHPSILCLATHKIAACFIGLLLVSGIAFATVQIVRNMSTSKPQLPTTEQTTDGESATSLSADTVKTDTIPAAPYIFDNVPLDSMLTAIAAVHGVEVEFENDAVRQLRFHFVWKHEDSITHVVEKLNTFEAVNIGLEGKKLIVR